jgi:hypothetical protein
MRLNVDLDFRRGGDEPTQLATIGIPPQPATDTGEDQQGQNARG